MLYLHACHHPKHILLHDVILSQCRNEREGIPIDLIHMLDDCVEIPQLGVVRSLNVHVSGALFVWEYAKQHSLQTEPSSIN